MNTSGLFSMGHTLTHVLLLLCALMLYNLTQIFTGATATTGTAAATTSTAVASTTYSHPSHMNQHQPPPPVERPITSSNTGFGSAFQL